MAGVYATLDNHGKKVTPTIVRRPRTASTGQTRSRCKDPIGDQVLSRETADTVTSVLTGVVDDGTGLGGRERTPAYEAARQDRYLRRQQVGLVHRLHARAGHRGRPVRRVRQGRPAGHAQGHRRRRPRQRRRLPGPGLGGLHRGALGGDTGAEFDLDTDLGAGDPADPHPDAEPTRRRPARARPRRRAIALADPVEAERARPPTRADARARPPRPTPARRPAGWTATAGAGGDGNPTGGNGNGPGGDEADSLTGFS